MTETGIEERLSFAVITDPAGNKDFLNKAILELPNSELDESRKSRSPVRVSSLEAIFVIGRLVDPQLTPEEKKLLDTARYVFQRELEHNKQEYSQMGITDIPRLVHHLKHHSKHPRWLEQQDLIPAFERLIGLKKEGGTWVNYGEARDRIVEQYREMQRIAQQSKIPVYFAADTLFFESVMPEQYWLHWNNMLLGTPKEKQRLCKVVGMIGIEQVIPEYAVDPAMRGKNRILISEFDPFQGAITITYGMPEEMHNQLKCIKNKIVIAGNRALFEETKTPGDVLRPDKPAEYYPGNLVFPQRPCGVSFYTFGSERGVQVLYFIHNNRLWRHAPSEINIKEMSVAAGKRPRPSHAEAAGQLLDIAAQIRRSLVLIEKTDPELARKIREAGHDNPRGLALYIKSLDHQVEVLERDKRNLSLQFVPFIEELVHAQNLQNWYADEKKKIYAENRVAEGTVASQDVDIKLYVSAINAVKECIERRLAEAVKAQQRGISSIKDLVQYTRAEVPLAAQSEDGSSKIGEEFYALAIDAVKKEFDKNKQIIDGLNNENKRLTSLSHSFDEKELQKVIDARAIEIAKSHLLRLKKRVEELETTNAELVRQRDTSDKAYRESQALASDNLKKAREEAAHYKQALQNPMEAARKNVEKEMSQKDERIRNLERQVGEKDRRIGDLEGQAGENDRKISELQHFKADYEKHQRELDGLKRDYALREKELKELKADYEKRNKEYEDFKKDYALREKELNDLKADYEKREKELGGLKNDYALREKELKELKADYEKRQRELEERIANISAQTRQLAFELNCAGHYKDAVAAYTIAISTAPAGDAKLSALYYNRAIAYDGLGRSNEAVADLEMALRINPENAGAREYLAEKQAVPSKKRGRRKK